MKSLLSSFLIVLAVAPVGAAEFKIRSLSRDGTITFPSEFTNGVATVEAAPAVTGPWHPLVNTFTTGSTIDLSVSLADPMGFFRLLTVDLSGGFSGFSNLVASYSTLSTIAGAGGSSNAGENKWQTDFEGGAATNALLSRPHIAMADDAGNIFIADKDAHGIRKIRPDGTIFTVAGVNTAGPGCDDDHVPGTTCSLNEPNGLWVRGDGTVYILDLQNGKVRRLDTNGFISTLFTVPGGINTGRGLWVKDDETLAYVCSGTVVKKWTSTGGVVNFATGFSGLGNLALDPNGKLVVTDRNDHSVYRISDDGLTKSRIAGNGTMSSAFGGGNGGLATLTGLNQVRAIWFLPTGAYFLGTDNGSQIWYVDTAGFIHLFLNGNAAIHAGDGPYFYNPTDLKVSKVRQITADREGNLLFAEHDSGYIRKVRFLRYAP